MPEKTKDKLWTKNFTIITLGTVVSLMGNAMSGFAISLLVLDFTGSTFFYVLFLVAYNLPKVLMPILAGPFLDRFSRRKMIYTLDFISAGTYALLAFLLYRGFFNYSLLVFFAVLVGCVDSTYTVAYESLYPNLVSEGNLAKANSITSIIMPLSQVMYFAAAVLYNTVGIVPLFLINAVSFLLAACFETQIKAEENYIASASASNTAKRFVADFKEGMSYIKAEKGLLAIAVYLSVVMFADASSIALMLPFFRENNASLIFPFKSLLFESGEYTFMMVMAFSVIGRAAGGLIIYRQRYPAAKKFTIAVVVYCVLCACGASVLFLPVALMMLFQFVMGIMGVTSYNIRVTGTQSYVSDEKRARFNGTFNMLNTFGTLAGQLTAGALAEVIPIRLVVVIFYGINLAAVFLVMTRNRKHVEPVYNIDV